MHPLAPVSPHLLSPGVRPLGRPGVPVAVGRGPLRVRGPQAPQQTQQAPPAQQTRESTASLVGKILQAGRAQDGAAVRQSAGQIPVADLRQITPWATRWWVPWLAALLIGGGGAIVPGTVPGVFVLGQAGPVAGGALAIWMFWNQIRKLQFAVEAGRYIRKYAPEIYAIGQS